MAKTDIVQLIDYANSVANEFESRLNRIRYFVSEHNLTSGTANEIILREFLAEKTPVRYGVSQGFICNPTDNNQSSKQCDILVYDQIDYPLVHEDGNIKVVWPSSVRLVMEVKTNLNKKELLYEAIENIRRAKNLRDMTFINGSIFAFNSLTIETILNHLKRYSETFKMIEMPNNIFLFDKQIIITTQKTKIPNKEGDMYSVFKTKTKGSLLAYLILDFMHITSGSLLQAQIIDAKKKLLEMETTKIGHVQIGENSQ